MNQNPYESPESEPEPPEVQRQHNSVATLIAKIFFGFVIGGWVGILIAPGSESWPIPVGAAIAGAVLMGLIRIG